MICSMSHRTGCARCTHNLSCHNSCNTLISGAGWTSVEKAIEGGAKWISENYINNSKYGQNTLYKMRWNPEKPAEHQYATDIAWASKQAKSMSSMFEAFPTAKYKFEIPRYSGQEKLEVK